MNHLSEEETILMEERQNLTGDVILTSIVGPECVELISIVQRAISSESLICL